MVKNPPANPRDIRNMDSIPESGRSPRGGHGNSLQYSCLENPIDGGTWWAIVHTVTESDMTEVTEHPYTHAKAALDEKYLELVNRKHIIFHQDNPRPQVSSLTRKKICYSLAERF